MSRLVLVLVLAPALAAAQAPSWDVEIYDPGAAVAAADLVLPTPCGGAMAFQRVDVPVDVANPLDDRRLRVGQSQADTGYSDYLRTDYLRGAFANEGGSHFYIARYELTLGQWRALSGDCGETTRRDRTAKGGLSWFDAVDLSRRYSEWLLANAVDSLPAEADGVAYLRLPTETEWEYAARGGAVVEPTGFAARRFFGEADLGLYAMFQGAGSARGEVLPVGLRDPNPLGLYDIYGNAEEVMLEPFRLNALGRQHGQAGGMVTRGGSVLSAAEQIYSAQRTEYPLFRAADGKALASDTFGLRLVLTRPVASSDASLREISATWLSLAEAPAAADQDPLVALAALIEEEADPRRAAGLTDLQLEFRVAREAAAEALRGSAKSTLLSGAVFIGALTDGADEIGRRGGSIRALMDQIRVSAGGQQGALLDAAQRIADEMEALRVLQRAYILSYRSALETLVSEIDPEILDAAFRLLQDELALSGQESILANLQAFNSDLSQFAARPDMPADDLLVMALAR